jgi:hypothetical protein
MGFSGISACPLEVNMNDFQISKSGADRDGKSVVRPEYGRGPMNPFLLFDTLNMSRFGCGEVRPMLKND